MARKIELDVCWIVVHIMAITFLTSVYSEPQPIWNFCYRNLCLCSKTYAKCTDNGNDLTYIPAFNRSIVGLNFSFNHLDSVTQRTFVNISELRISKLILRSNNIKFISPDAFEKFGYLENLELSGNPIGLESLKGVFQHLAILPVNMLSINSMNYGDKLYEAVAFLDSVQLTEMHMDWCGLTYYNQTSFKHIPKLIKLDIDNNIISRIIVDHHWSLKTLSINNNSLFTFPKLCVKGTYSGLTELFLDSNRITYLEEDSMRCLTKLNILTLQYNPINRIKQNTFAKLQSLRVLILRTLNGPLRHIEQFAFNNSELFRIDLRDNGINMKLVSPRMFWGCMNLKRLSLSFNQFHYISLTAMEELFHPLKQLTYLDLGSCGLETIPKVITTALHKLKWLSLYKNYIKTWSSDTFEPLKSLTELYLMGNQIGNIQENSFPLELRERLKHINLADNPFSCTCDLMWFLNWFKTNRSIFKQYDHSYTCSSPLTIKTVQLIDVQLSEQECLVPVTTIFAIVVIASFGVFFTITFSLLYRKRWTLKHYWYMRDHRQRRQMEIERVYTYDVFVIYSEGDLPWIRREMLPILEDTKGLNLCVHQRDFMPGKPVINEIVESIHCSRGFILVASNWFVEDEWCQFQLQVALQHNNARDLDLLMVILLEEVDPRHITPTLYGVLQTKDYMLWPAVEEDRVKFWDDVHREMDL